MLLARLTTPLAILLTGATVLLLAATANAADGAAELRFENHRFAPQTVSVSAGQPLTIKVVNAGEETIEFESFKLGREKAVEPGETVTVHLPALSPGTYEFSDDFHHDVPEGAIVAR